MHSSTVTTTDAGLRVVRTMCAANIRSLTGRQEHASRLLGGTTPSYVRSAGRASTSEADASKSSSAQQSGPARMECAACTGEQTTRLTRRILEGLTVLELADSILPHSALAAEAVPIELLKGVLDQVESLGPLGPVLFVGTVAFFEMIPLFPTQPLSLASGLVFGTVKGAALNLTGVTLAALGAFSLARGVGRPLAERVIQQEIGEEGAGKAGLIKSKLAGVQKAIDNGSSWQQYVAVTLLRLTPVVPFSASNYVLGLTPIQLSAYVGGTLTGMTFWSTVFASIGGASRALLNKDVSLEVVFSDITEQAKEYTEEVLVAGLILALLAAGVQSLRLKHGQLPFGQREPGAMKEKLGNRAKDRV